MVIMGGCMNATQDRWVGIDRRKQDRRQGSSDRRELIRYISVETRTDRRSVLNRRRVPGEWLPTHIN